MKIDKAALEAWLEKTRRDYLAGRLTAEQIGHLRRTGFPLPRRGEKTGEK